MSPTPHRPAARAPIWSKLDFLHILVPRADAKAEVARRWVRARRDNPELLADLIRLGGVLKSQPFQMIDGAPEVAPMDPQRLAYEAGWRDLALHLSALMGLSTLELNSLMEKNDAYADPDED